MTQAQIQLQSFDTHARYSNILGASSLSVTKAIHQGQIALSISSMLGCDYLFINHDINHPLLEKTQLLDTLQHLLEIFETTPRQSQLISINETSQGQLTFTRYDYIWDNDKILDVISSPITHSEQIEFMIMMYNCSSMC